MDMNAKLPLSGLAIDTSWPTLKDNEVLAGDLDKERRNFWGLAIDGETPAFYPYVARLTLLKTLFGFLNDLL